MKPILVMFALLALYVHTARSQAAESLKVLSMFPQGQLESPNQALAIVATFSEAMVPIQAIPEGEGTGPLAIHPPVAGRFRWLGTSTIAFTPSKPLELATEYTVAVKAGTRALDGSSLANDVSWSFTTQRPVLLGTRPGHGSKGVDIHTMILLHVNQQVITAKTLSIIKLFEARRNGPEVRFSLSHPTQQEMQAMSLSISDSTMVVKITPSNRLKKKTKYVVLLQPGLPGARGALGIEKEASFSFETYPDFAFVELVGDRKRNPRDALTLRFTTPASVAECVRHIAFSPPLDVPKWYEEWSWSSTEVLLALPLAPRST